MAATELVKSTRYFRPEITKVYYLPSTTDYTAVTRQELDGGTDLSVEISTIEGFGVTSGVIETPDLVSRFTSKIGGRTSVEDSSITFYASQNSDDVRTVLPRGTTGHLAILGGGDVAGQTMDVYPISVIAAPKQYTLEDEAAKLMLQFSVTREPSENQTIPS